MKIESLMWLLVVVFMFHDFEEIIMMQAWTRKNGQAIRRRFPGALGETITRHGQLSAPAFAMAVAEEFVVLSTAVYFCVAYGLYTLWTAVLIGFFSHLIVHLGQALVFRAYVPAVLTSLLSSGYCLAALIAIWPRLTVAFSELGWISLACLGAIAANLAFAFWLAGKFEAWLATYSKA
jgi:hypothetical protein